MAGPYIHDRVKDTTTTTGTGALTVANSAPTGFRTIGSVLSNNDTFLYTVAHQTATEWEDGIGTYSTTGPTVTRTTVLRSSNANAAVNFSAGTKDIFIAPIVDHADKWLHVTDTFANLAALQAGRVLFPSNGFSLYRDTGSLLVPWGPSFQFTEPISGDFAWVNQGSATVSTTNGGIYLEDLTSASSQYQHRIRKKTAPSTPYTITMAFLYNADWFTPTGSDGCWFGAVFRQSSDGLLHLFQIKSDQATASVPAFVLSSSKWVSAANNFSAYYDYAYVHMMGRPVIWLRIADNGTNRICSTSSDGQNWIVQHSIGRTNYLTADEVGFSICPYAAACGMTLLSWKEG